MASRTDRRVDGSDTDLPEARSGDDSSHAAELRKEAFTMALYVAISLLAALIAIPDGAVEHVHPVSLVWGTTVGLAIAHWFAFRLSALLVASGAVRRHDAETAGAQIAGAAVVGALATVPLVVVPESAELQAVRLVLALFVAVVGYAVARVGGAARLRAVVYATSVAAVAVLVAVAKNELAGH